eukprot:TRINITY_DN8742_c0_g2_i3.p1 TRINITY_DN8742_c0_g2~~TRINITY_DN8742_c0_g2_i3.p1  ORF type:complete len:563 (+),score=62.05 TRINITY_DN8742_c0_g2_i3:228-1916(+)
MMSERHLEIVRRAAPRSASAPSSGRDVRRDQPNDGSLRVHGAQLGKRVVAQGSLPDLDRCPSSEIVGSSENDTEQIPPQEAARSAPMERLFSYSELLPDDRTVVAGEKEPIVHRGRRTWIGRGSGYSHAAFTEALTLNEKCGLLGSSSRRHSSASLVAAPALPLPSGGKQTDACSVSGETGDSLGDDCSTSKKSIVASSCSSTSSRNGFGGVCGIIEAFAAVSGFPRKARARPRGILLNSPSMDDIDESAVSVCSSMSSADTSGKPDFNMSVSTLGERLATDMSGSAALLGSSVHAPRPVAADVASRPAVTASGRDMSRRALPRGSVHASCPLAGRAASRPAVAASSNDGVMSTTAVPSANAATRRPRSAASLETARRDSSKLHSRPAELEARICYAVPLVKSVGIRKDLPPSTLAAAKNAEQKQIFVASASGRCIPRACATLKVSKSLRHPNVLRALESNLPDGRCGVVGGGSDSGCEGGGARSRSACYWRHGGPLGGGSHSGQIGAALDGTGGEVGSALCSHIVRPCSRGATARSSTARGGLRSTGLTLPSAPGRPRGSA